MNFRSLSHNHSSLDRLMIGLWEYVLYGNALEDNTETMDNQECSSMCNMSWYMHVSPLFHELHCIPSSFWIWFKILVIIYKPLYSIGSGYLKNCLIYIFLPVWWDQVEWTCSQSCWSNNVTRPRKHFFLMMDPNLRNKIPHRNLWQQSLLTFCKL